MRTRLLALVAAWGVAMLGLLAASPAHAKVHTLAVARVSVDVPSKWKVEISSDQLNLTTKDQTLAISLTHVAAADLDASWAEVEPAVGAMLTNASVGAKKAGVLGGMDGYVTTATGVFEGKDVQMLLALLRTPSQHQLMVVALGQVGRYEKHEKAMTKILNSLKADKPAFNDEGFFQLVPEAQAFAEQVVKAVEKNDQKGFVKLAIFTLEGSGGFAVYSVDGGGEEYSAKALAKLLKKGKKIARALYLPEQGDWHVEYKGDAERFRVWRGDWTDYVTFIDCVRHDGRWWMMQVVTDYGAAKPPTDDAGSEDM